MTKQRGPNRKLTTLSIVAVLTVGLAAVAAMPNAQHFYLEPDAPNTLPNPAAVIKVSAVGQSDVYDTIDVEGPEENLNFRVKVRGSCDEGWHLGGAEMKVNSQTDPGVRVAQLEYDPDHRSIGPGHGAEWSLKAATIPYLTPSNPSSPVAACNNELARRIADGQSKSGLLKTGIVLSFPQAYSGRLQVRCTRKHLGFYESTNYGADTKLPLTLRCMPTDYKAPRTPTPPPPPPKRKPAPEPPLESVALAAVPPATNGRPCPLYVNFSGKIVANVKSPYETFNTKYRFIGDHGYQTDWLSVAVNRDVARTIHSKRFIQAPMNDPGGTILAQGEKATIPLYRGWMTLEVQLPYGPIQSERANFTVDCNVAPAKPRIKAKN